MDSFSLKYKESNPPSYIKNKQDFVKYSYKWIFCQFKKTKKIILGKINSKFIKSQHYKYDPKTVIYIPMKKNMENMIMLVIVHIIIQI